MRPKANDWPRDRFAGGAIALSLSGSPLLNAARTARAHDLAFHTRNACEQLMRYGGGVASVELLDVLEIVAEINDDMQHGRTESAREQIARAKALLDRLEP